MHRTLEEEVIPFIKMKNSRVLQFVLVLLVCLLLVFISNMITGNATKYYNFPANLIDDHLKTDGNMNRIGRVSSSDSNIIGVLGSATLKYNRERDDLKIKRTPSKGLKSDWTIFNPKYINNNNNITDILSMKPIEYNPMFKNPCWTEGTPAKKRLHCLAYFFIAGFMKSATTDLHSRLVKHPQIKVSYRKEPKFWSKTRYFGMTLSQHSRLIAKRLIASDSDVWYRVASHYVLGDATPLTVSKNYYCRLDPNNGGSTHDSAIPKYRNPQFLRHALPNAKIIIIMRNPADRLYSAFHFLHTHRNRSPRNPALRATPNEFHANTVKAVTIMDACRMKYGHYKCIVDYNHTADMPNSMEDYHITSYATIIKDWLDIFPRKQLLFIRTEDYAQNIAYYMNKIVAFLELDTLSPRTLKQTVNLTRGNKQRRYPPMANKTRELIDRYYLSEREELSSLLGDERYLWKEFLQTRSTK